jgi:adenylate cyclase
MDDANRRLAGILAADVVGYSAMVGKDEPATLARVRSLRTDLIEPLSASHGGRLFKTTGDGFLAAFASAVQALRCAIAIQERLNSEPEAVQLRIGVHQGEVVAEGDDLLGDGVIIAARLEPLAEPGGICISARVREDAAGKIALEVDDIGTPELKNIAAKVQVFRVRLGVAERPVLALPDKPSLVVLPFQNMSGDPEQEYFTDGMVEEITTALSRIGGLFVIARNSAFTYKGRAIDVRQVGHELGVRYVVEGSVRKSGNRVRITCQLIAAATAAHVWADRFDSELADIFDLQDRVTEQIAGAVEPNLRRAEILRALAKPTENLTAYDLYYRALHLFFQGTKDDLVQGLGMLHRAIDEDPGFALARALAAGLIARGVLVRWLPRDTAHVSECTVLAKSALRDGTDDAEVLAWAGWALSYLSDERSVGHAAVEKAMTLNPNSPTVLLAGAASALYTNRPADSRDRLLRGMRLSPLEPRMQIFLSDLAGAALGLGDAEQGLAYARRCVEANPGGHQVHRPLIYCLVALGRIEEAREVARDMVARYPGETISRNLGHFQAFTPEQRERFVHALRLAGLPE